MKRGKIPVNTRKRKKKTLLSLGCGQTSTREGAKWGGGRPLKNDDKKGENIDRDMERCRDVLYKTRAKEKMNGKKPIGPLGKSGTVGRAQYDPPSIILCRGRGKRN